MGDILTGLAGGLTGAAATLLIPSIRRFVWGPELKLDFDKDGEGFIAKTPILMQEPGNQPIIHEGIYIRVKVTNVKCNLAKQCRAFLVNIEKQNKDGIFKPTIYCDSIQLQWACRENQGFSAIDLPNGIMQFIDILATIKNFPYYEMKIGAPPFRYIDLFSESGIFRFTIQVSGDEVIPKFIRLIFYWREKWDDFDVSLDKKTFLPTSNYLINYFRDTIAIWIKNKLKNFK